MPALLVAIAALLAAATDTATAGSQYIYRNPVLAGDYSDPDVIRVGNTFYMTSSSFANAPGLPVLASKDLVHWTIVSHALSRLLPDTHYSVPRRGGGVWAPAIRYHGGRYMIFYPDPDRGIYVVTASDPRGPWTAPTLVDDTKGAIDPAPFWDDDGSGWLVKAFAQSRAGFSNVLELRRLDDAGTKAVGPAIRIVDGATLQSARTSRGPMPWFTLEGPKVYKRGGWYYIFAPAGSVKGGWQGVLRSRSIAGPYEARVVMDQGSTPFNGPHQGAWVTDIAGADWFLHFQDADAYGRRVLLEPMRWGGDGWPIIGEDPDGDGIGQPVAQYRMPASRGAVLLSSPAASDAFSSSTLGAQWQWNANPASDWADLTAKPGSLRLASVSSPANLWEAGAVLTQKLPSERFTATVRLAFAGRAIGERAGLVLFGRAYGWIGLERTPAGRRLVRVARAEADTGGPETVVVGLADAPAEVWLRLDASPVVDTLPPPGFSPYWPSMLRERNIEVRFSYSLDGKSFVPIDGLVIAKQGRWVGAQLGVFAQAPAQTPAYTAPRVGWADFSAFKVDPGPDQPASQGVPRHGD